MTREELQPLLEAPRQDRMVVYLDLPQISGLEALEKAKHDPTIGHTPMDILLVDDNPGDVRMMVEALKEALPAARLSVAVDGIEALRFLRREGRHYKAPRPDLIFLDLRMPKKTGFDVLEEVNRTRLWQAFRWWSRPRRRRPRTSNGLTACMPTAISPSRRIWTS
jgi:CheY-like chemotaxis protein